MNRNHYPAWLNILVLVIFLSGALFALPNIYGTAPAIQLADPNGDAFTESQIEGFVSTLTSAELVPENVFLQDGRVVVIFDDVEKQKAANDMLRDVLEGRASVAMTLAPNLPDWLRNLGLSPMSLGLDLRGGVYVLLEVDMDTAIGSRLQSYHQAIMEEISERGVGRSIRAIEPENGVIQVQMRSADDLEQARNIVRAIDNELLLIDGADGQSLRVRMSDTQIRARQDFAIEQNMTTLRNRVNALGVAEPLVQRQGIDRIVVQLPGVQDPNELNKILTATATLEYRMVDVDGTSPGSRRFPGRDGIQSRILKREVIVSGSEIIDAEAGFSQGQPAVFITLDAAGGERMLRNTQENVGKLMSTVFIETRRVSEVIDGQVIDRTVRTEEIINTATIQGIFKDRFQTTGLNTTEANQLALLLRAGALAAPVYKIAESTIGPSLGQDNIDRGFMAVQIGFLAVIVFMAFYYRWFGVIASLALFTNLIFIVALLSLLQASLTLPGIAGIVLTVGMAVDANVLIFERIREEIASGATPQNAIYSGYDKAFSSIMDANVTTLIAALVLFVFGTGPIKGFAITLTLGIMTSMFTAIIGTRSIVNLVFGDRKIDSVPV